MKVLVVEPNREPYVLEIDNTLEEMQKLVGGYIQAVYPFVEEIALICNEEGKLMNLPFNRLLTDTETNLPYDFVCGTFFLCACPSESEDFEGLNDEQIKRYIKLYSMDP